MTTNQILATLMIVVPIVIVFGIAIWKEQVSKLLWVLVITAGLGLAMLCAFFYGWILAGLLK